MVISVVGMWVGSVVGGVTNVGIVVGSVVGTGVGSVVGIVVGNGVGSVVGMGVGSVVGIFVVLVIVGVISPTPISADTGMAQTAHSIRITIIMKNRLFTVSLPVL